MKANKSGFTSKLIRNCTVVLASVLLMGPIHSSFAVPGDELPTVQRVDLERYMGQWFEISALPQQFQQGCFATKADYSLKPDGNVKVVNSCRRGGLDGELTVAEGNGWVVDTRTNAKLKVSFQPPFSGDYWILALENNYEYAMVGTPDRKSLWILARSTDYDVNIVNSLLTTAEWYGFDTSAMNWTVHQ